MDYESANMAKLKLALILSNLKPSFNDSNPSTALYNAIETSFQFLLRNKLTGLFTDDSNRNRIILSTDGEDVNSIKSSLIQACEQTKQICQDWNTDMLMIGIGLEVQGRNAMNHLKESGRNKCKF
ncbi:unnamed protein product, partial [Rotaria sordida]